MISTELLIFTGALLGGYASGLTGFGTALTAMPIWLFAVQPIVAGPIVVLCSIVSQLQTLPSIWKWIHWKTITPFVLTAIVGIPIGTFLLSYTDSTSFRLGIALLLIFYSTTMLIKRRRSQQIIVQGNRVIDALVGFIGGVLGGIAGLSGVLPTIWISFRNWDKNKKRGFFQGFNLTVLGLSLVSMWIAGYLTLEVLSLVTIAIPGTLIGTWLGRKTYNGLDNTSFDSAVLFLFLISGVAIVVFWISTELLDS